MFYKLFFWVFFGIPVSCILLFKIFSGPDLIDDQKHQENNKTKITQKGSSEIVIDSFLRYEVPNFVVKSNSYLSCPPRKVTEKIIDQAAKMFPNSMELKHEFERQCIGYYFQKHPYLYEVKIKEIDVGENENNTYLSINLFRYFNDSEIRAIISEELKVFGKQSEAQVIKGFAMINNETTMQFDGINCLYYVRKIDKVLNHNEFAIFRIEAAPKDDSINPTFDWFKGDHLKNDIYDFEISSPLACLQPKSIRAIIGEYGQNLKGPNVVISSYGICNVIRFKDKIFINRD